MTADTRATDDSPGGDAALVRFLLDTGVLRFGDFTAKSGRKTPYFFDFGRVSTGPALSELGSYYADHAARVFGEGFDVVFGPAYKGIPLAAAAAEALHRRHGRTVWFSSDRKERKEHGEKSSFLGRTPSSGDRVLVVEDIVTAGTTFRTVVPLLRSLPGVTVVGAVVAVDRCERGESELSARAEVEAAYGFPVSPLLTARRVLDVVTGGLGGAADPGSGDPGLADRISAYLDRYGAR